MRRLCAVEDAVVEEDGVSERDFGRERRARGSARNIRTRFFLLVFKRGLFSLARAREDRALSSFEKAEDVECVFLRWRSMNLRSLARRNMRFKSRVR